MYVPLIRENVLKLGTNDLNVQHKTFFNGWLPSRCILHKCKNASPSHAKSDPKFFPELSRT